MSEQPAIYGEARAEFTCSGCGARANVGRERIVLSNGGWLCTSCQQSTQRVRDAAPEMLRTLRAIHRDATGGWPADMEAWMNEIRDAAAAAIVAATGEQP